MIWIPEKVRRIIPPRKLYDDRRMSNLLPGKGGDTVNVLINHLLPIASGILNEWVQATHEDVPPSCNVRSSHLLEDVRKSLLREEESLSVKDRQI
jgi:hypothetical protein